MECAGCQKTERRLAFSGDKKPGNFYSDPWTARPGGGGWWKTGDVGELDHGRASTSGVTISVINGLLAALALGLASARLR